MGILYSNKKKQSRAICNNMDPIVKNNKSIWTVIYSLHFWGLGMSLREQKQDKWLDLILWPSLLDIYNNDIFTYTV